MTSKTELCKYDELRFKDVNAGFSRESLGGDPVLTIADGLPDSWITLSLAEARALREWLNGTLGAHETAAQPSNTADAFAIWRRFGLNDEWLVLAIRNLSPEKAVETPPALRIEHTCPACGAKLLTESSPETDCLECGATASEKCLRGEFPCLRDVRSTEKAVETPAMHASAPQGCQCADCTMDKEPCPDCYSAWWRNRHPDTKLVYSTSEKASEPLDTEERCDECGRWLFASQLTSHPYCRKCGQGTPEKAVARPRDC